VDRDVNLILVTDLLEALVEVLHVFDQQSPGEVEVPLLVLAIVNDVDHDGILEVGPLDVAEQVLGRTTSGCGGGTRRSIV